MIKILLLLFSLLSRLSVFYPLSIVAEERGSFDPLSRLFPSLSSEERLALEKEGESTRYYFEAAPPLWIPRRGLGVEILREIAQIETVIGVESIHLLRYTEAGRLLDKPVFDAPETQTSIHGVGGQGSPSYPNGVAIPRGSFLKFGWLLEVYNRLLSVSTMKGIEYYSASRGRMRTLFEQSYVIENPQDLKPIPDPWVAEIPAELTLHVFQEDLTFGKNISRWKYYSQGNEIAVSITNLTPMKYSFFTVAEPGNMQIHLLVMPAEEGIVFYGCMVAKSPRFLGLEKTRTESFYNRIKALFTWFKKGM